MLISGPRGWQVALRLPAWQHHMLGQCAGGTQGRDCWLCCSTAHLACCTETHRWHGIWCSQAPPHPTPPPAHPPVRCRQVAEEDELGAKPKRRGKVMSDYEKWEIAQLIKSGGCGWASNRCPLPRVVWVGGWR